MVPEGVVAWGETSFFVEDNSRYRFVIESLVVLVRGCVGIVWASAGPLLPLLMQAFGISRGAAGWFASAAPITIAAVSLPLSIFLSRHSLKKTFAVGAFLQGAGVLAPLADSYALVVVTRILFAIGTAVTVPVATAILAEWFASRKLPLVTGVMMSFINLGNAIAFVATVPIATVISWQAPIAAYGAFAITCATAWVIFGKDRKTPRPSVEARAVGTADATASLGMLDTRPDLGFRQIVSQRATVMLSLAVMGSWALGNAIGSWLPNYYHEVFDMPLEKASSILAVTTVGGTLACIAGGILPTRLGRRKPFIVASGAVVGLSAVSAVLFNNPVMIFVSVSLFGIFGNIQNPSLFTIPVELPNMSVRSGVVVLSVMQAGGNLGNFVGPLIVGYIADFTGSYLPGFFVCAALSLSLLAAGLLLPETGPKGRASATAKQAAS